MAQARFCQKCGEALPANRTSRLFILSIIIVGFLALAVFINASAPSNVKGPSSQSSETGQVLTDTLNKWNAERNADPLATKEEIVCRARRKTAIQEGDDPDVAYSKCISAMRQLGIK